MCRAFGPTKRSLGNANFALGFGFRSRLGLIRVNDLPCRCGYLFEDGLGGGCGVVCLRDGPAYDEQGGSLGDGSLRGGYALLIACGGACGADSGDYEKGVRTRSARRAATSSAEQTMPVIPASGPVWRGGVPVGPGCR